MASTRTRLARHLILSGATTFAAGVTATILTAPAVTGTSAALAGTASWRTDLTNRTPIAGQSLEHDTVERAPLDAAIYAPNSAQKIAQAINAAAAMPLAAHSHRWVERGPFGVDFITGIANGGEHLGPIGGMVTAIAVDPSDKTGNTAFYGQMGGLYVTHDGGKTATNLSDGNLSRAAVGAIAVDPKDPKTIYVGTGISLFTISGDANGTGVWVSHDRGKHFVHPKANVAAYGVNHMLVTSKAVLVGTNAGLYRSTDHGRSFHRVALPTNASHTGQGPDPFGNWITAIVQRPDRPNEITVAVGFGMGNMIGADGKPVAPGNGLYRSTKYGAPGSWHFMNESSTVNGLASSPDATSDPMGEIGLAYGSAPGQGGVMWALVSDAGRTRGHSAHDLPDTPDPLGLGVDPLKTSELGGLYRSLDDGKTWTLQATSETLLTALNSTQAGLAALDYAPGVQSSYNNWVLTDPVDPNRVYIGLEEAFEGEYGIANPTNIANPGNIPLHSKFQVIERYADICGFYTSVGYSELGLVTGNGGQAATQCPSQVPLYGGVSTHPDQHAAAIARTPGGGVRMYSGNDGGLFVQDANSELDSILGSGNIRGFGNGEWRAANRISTTQPYHADFWSKGRLILGLQDNGAVYVTPTGKGVEICGGDAIEVFPGPTPDSMFCTHGGGFMDYITQNGKATYDASPFLVTPFGLTPLAQDSTDRTHIIAAGEDVQELVNPKTDAWVTVFNLGASPTAAFAGPYCPATVKATQCNWQATALSLHGAHAYAGICGPCRNTFGDTSLVRSAIATNVKPGCQAVARKHACWHIERGRGLPRRPIAGIAFDTRHPETVYVGLKDVSLVGYDPKINGRQRVMVSHDGGATFRDVSGNLPYANVFGLVLRNGHPIIGTDVGVFTAAPGSSHWQRLGRGLPQVRAQDVRLDSTGRYLVASMFGRGVWVYDFGHRATSGSNVNPPGSGNPHGTGDNLATTGASGGLAVIGLVLVAAGILVRRRAQLATPA